MTRALERLDGLVDWERRARSDHSGRLMRQSVAPARALLDRVGAPDRGLRCVLVAGTKGKGSVASLIAAGLRAAGEREAAYASPHVERVNERVRIGGRDIADRELAAALELVLDAQLAAEDAGAEATWFDVVTAAALLAMRDAGVQWAILECGLGGRLDSTNAVEPELGVITNISLEHTAILGTTRAAIAREKAGIARAGVALVSGAGGEDDEAGRAIGEVATEVGARLVRVEPPAPSTPIAERNRRLANAALAELGYAPLEDGAERDAALPGRMEFGRIGPTPVILDGAHVPASLDAVLAELARDSRLPGLPTVVFGCGADKDVASLLKVLRGRVDRVVCTSLVPGPYASPERLLDEAASIGLPAEAAADPGEALSMAAQRIGTQGWILVTGSLHLVGATRSRVRIARENETR